MTTKQTAAALTESHSNISGALTDLWMLIVLLGFVVIRLLGSKLFHHVARTVWTGLVR